MDGWPVVVRRLRRSPRLARLGSFLTASECEHIISLGVRGGGLHLSRVVRHGKLPPRRTPPTRHAAADGNGHGREGEGEGSASNGSGRDDAASDGDDDDDDDGGDDDPAALHTAGRTSESCCVSAREDAVVKRAVERAAALVGLTPDHAEAAQLVHYTPGQEYRPHFDFYSPRGAAYRVGTAVQGNRLVSVFAYLSDVSRGGCTAFPLLDERFPPRRGDALLWYNLGRDGLPDPLTLHAGEPVEQGEKWGMNIWLRERPRLRVAGTCPGGAGGPWVAAQLTPRLVPSEVAASPREKEEEREGEGEEEEEGPAARHVLVRVALMSALPSPRRRVKPAAVSLPACLRCGDVAVGPVGLCLCEGQYPREALLAEELS